MDVKTLCYLPGKRPGEGVEICREEATGAFFLAAPQGRYFDGAAGVWCGEWDREGVHYGDLVALLHASNLLMGQTIAVGIAGGRHGD